MYKLEVNRKFSFYNCTQEKMLFIEQNCFVEFTKYFIELTTFFDKSNRYLKLIKSN